MKQTRHTIRKLGGVFARQVETLLGTTSERRQAALKTSSMLASRLTLEAMEPRLLLSADLPPVPGNIEVPGASDSYTFTLAEPTKFLFDAQSRSAPGAAAIDSAKINWSLSGPDGQVVAPRLFSASDGSKLTGTSVLDLGVGEYRLTVDGVGDATGLYGFRLLDLAQADAILPGATVAGSTTADHSTNLYKFDALAGDRLFLDRLTLTGATPTWRLLGPDGEQVFTAADMADRDDLKIGRSGTYTLAIEGDIDEASSSYTFAVHRITDQDTDLPFNQLVTGRIDQPGSVSRYHFSLDSAATLLFDALNPSSNLNWTLTGPSGTIFGSRSFSNLSNDPYEPVLALEQGDYTLTIDGTGDATDAYAFRILDFANATAVQSEQPFTSTLTDAGASRLTHRVPGAPLQGSAGLNQAWYGKTNAFFEVPSNASLQPQRLTIEAWFKLDDNPNANNQAIANKNNGTGSGTGWGMILDADDKVDFFVNGSSTIVTMPQPLVRNAWTHLAGTYDGEMIRLYVDGVEVASKAYTGALGNNNAPLVIGQYLQGTVDEVRVWDRARSAGEVAAARLAPLAGTEAGLVGYWRFDENGGGVLVDSSPLGNNGAIVNEPAREARLYKITGTAGSRLYFNQINSITGTGTVYARLYAPDGRQLYSTTSIDDFEAVLPATGDYIVAIEAVMGNDRPLTLTNSIRVFSDAPAATLTPGTPISGVLAVGDTARYGFTLEQDGRFYADALTATADVNWSLVGPLGVVVDKRVFNSTTSAVYALPKGTYQLIVDGAGQATGAYALNLIDLASAPQLTFGEPLTDKVLSPGLSAHAYQFTAAAGDRLTVDYLYQFSVNAYYRIVDPFGREVIGRTQLGDNNNINLSFDGTYTLLVEGEGTATNTVTYSLRLDRTAGTPPAALTGTAITIGSLVQGPLPANGIGDYLFTTTGPTRLLFDSLTNSGSTWAVTGPRGSEISGFTLYNGESDGTFSNTVLDLPVAGTYRLRIIGLANENVAFRILDLAQATPILTGSATRESVSGTFTVQANGAARATQPFTFQADAGERFFLDVVTGIPSGSGKATFRLIDPAGRLVVGPANFADSEFTTALAGAYTLLIEGANNNGVLATGFAFDLVRVGDKPAVDIALGKQADGSAQVIGALALPGERQSYRFSVTARTFVVVDAHRAPAGVSTSDFTWALKGPGGSVASSGFEADDSTGRGVDRVLRLDPGTYEFTVDAAGAAVGAFAFSLLDLGLAPDLPTDGTVVAASASPAGEADIYSFTAAAGDRFRLETTGSGLRWRLVDQWGAQVATRATLATNTFDVPRAGRYTLVVEGPADGGAAALAYSLALSRFSDTQEALPAAGVVDAALVQPGQRKSYSFTLDAAKTMLFDARSGNAAMSWTLTGPYGQLATATFDKSDGEDGAAMKPLKLTAGTYTVTVTSTGTTKGAFGFALLDTANAMPITLGQPMSGALSPAAETDMWSFTATAGERYYLDLTQFPATAKQRIRIIDPAGSEAFVSATAADMEFKPLRSGTYTITIEGNPNDTGSTSYRFALHRAQDILTPLLLDGALTGPFSEVRGSGNALALTGHETLRATAPELDTTGSVTIDLSLRPDQLGKTVPLVFKGNGVGGRTFALHLNANGSLTLSTADATGLQQLATAANVVTARAWNRVAAVIDRTTGAMRIYVNDALVGEGTIRTGVTVPTAATPLWIAGSPEADTPARFEGALDEVRMWAGARTLEQLQDDATTPPAAGTAGLLVRLPLDEATGATAVANLATGGTVAVVRDMAGVTGVVEGRLGTPGEVRTYSFDLAQDGLLLFDTFHDLANYADSQVTVRITGPGNLSVTRNLRNGDLDEFNNTKPIIVAPAGHYTVTFDAPGDYAGAYAFRIADLRAQPLAPIGTPISGSLAAAETRAYRIEATAGERLFIDAQMLSASTLMELRLIDPFGRDVMNSSAWADIDTVTLAYSGAYTLIVSQRPDNPRPADFRLAVQKLPPVAPIAILPGVKSGDTAGIAPGKVGDAQRFGGANYVDATHGNILGDLTIEAWVKPDRLNAGYVPIVQKGDIEGDLRAYGIYVSTAGALFGYAADAEREYSFQSDSALIKPGEWAHVAMVLDRTTGVMRLVVNGSEVKTASLKNFSGQILPGRATSAKMTIGRMQRADSSYAMFEGAIDEVRLWSTARTVQELKDNASLVPPAGTAGLVLRVPLDGSPLPANVAAHDLNANGVSGRIEVPGDSRTYSFELANDSTLLFDSLTSNSNLNWTLTGPTGTIVSARSFHNSDFDVNPLLRLRQGSYTLTVDAANDHTGTFAFRLLDLAEAAPIALGTRIEGVLAPGTESKAFRFTAAKGDVLYLDQLGGDTNHVRWRLVDGAGFNILPNTNYADVADFVIPANGTYALVLEGNSLNGGQARYAFNVQPIDYQTVALPLNAAVRDTIATAGEINRYSFTLNQATRVVFDSLTDSSLVRWSLQGPGGLIVDSRSFKDSDNTGLDGASAMLLAAGTWTLSVDGVNDLKDFPYGFRLLTLPSQAVATANLPFNGTLGETGREGDAIAFEATAGMLFQVDFDLPTGTNSARWRLIDPLGQTVMGPSELKDTEVLTAAIAGTYHVLVEGAVNATADIDYRFTVRSFAQPEAAAGVTVQDFETNEGGLPWAIRNVSGTAVAQVLESTTSNGRFLRLTRSDTASTSASVAFSSNASGPQHKIEAEFDFRITKRSNQATGGDGLAFLLMPNALFGTGGIGPVTTIEPNVTGALGIGFDSLNTGSDPNGNHVSVHWNGAIVQTAATLPFTLSNGLFNHARVLLERTGGGALLTVELTSPDTAAVIIIDKLFLAGMELTGSRVMIGAQTGTTQTADQDIDNVALRHTAAALQTPTFTPGETEVNGTVGRAGGVYLHQFTLTEPTSVVFDALTNNDNLRWTMTGPTQTGGLREFKKSDSSQLTGNPVMQLAAGTYTVAVSATSNATPSYSFRLLPLSLATEIATTGDAAMTPTEVTLDPGNLTKLYAFDGTVGQRIYVDFVSGSTLPGWRLIGPNGNVVASAGSLTNLGEQTLDQTGRYTLLIEGHITDAAPTTSRFRVATIVDSTTQLTVDNTIVSGRIGTPGEQDRYTFSLDSGRLLQFNSMTNLEGITWTLHGPSGKLESRNFNATSTPVLYAAAGDYELVIDGTGDIAADYGFQLLDLSQAVPIAVDQQNVVQLLGSEAVVYRINATKGDRWYFEPSGSQTVNWRLLDPYGKPVLRDNGTQDFDFSATFDVETFAFPHTGAYTLIVDGVVSSTTARELRFNAWQLDVAPKPITIGTVINDAIAEPGESDAYRFEVTTPRRVYIDVQVFNHDLHWGLTGPNGLVATRNFNASDGFNQTGQVVYELPVGVYTLTVGIAGRTTVPYQIALLDADNAIEIDFSKDVSGTLEPSNETNFYAFDAEEGDRLFFDARLVSKNWVGWRLLGPDGRQLFLEELPTDIDTLTMPMTGRYTLLLEGRTLNDADPRQYTFRIFTNPLGLPVPILGIGGEPGPDLAVSSEIQVEGELRSGGAITVSWTTTNAGNRPASSGNWVDRVVLTNATTGAFIAEAFVPYTGELDPSGTVRRTSLPIELPEGNTGAGDIRVTVELDTHNAVEEHNGDDDAESNNSASRIVTSALADYADLQVRNLTVGPDSGWTAGQSATVSWQTVNTGKLPTPGAWRETLVVRNESTAQTVFTRTIDVTGALSKDELSALRTLDVPFATDLLATGRFAFEVSVDVGGVVEEYNLGGTGETNNALTLQRWNAPDLRVEQLAIIGSAAPAAGDVVTLEWWEVNAGSAPTRTGWDSRIALTDMLGNQIVAKVVSTAEPLAKEGRRYRTATIQVPHGSTAVGAVRFTVTVDSAGAVREIFPGVNAENNNFLAVEAQVVARGYPDLAATLLSAPAAIRGGQSYQVSWKVENKSATAAVAEAGKSWVDAVILTKDDVIGNADDIRFDFAASGSLAGEGNYTQTKTIDVPEGYFGEYQIFVRPDAGGAVIEPSTQADNDSPRQAVAMTSPAANLVTEALFGPALAVQIGEYFEVSWRVRNAGDIAASGSWTDRLVVSGPDGRADLVLAEEARTEVLPTGEAGVYTVKKQVRITDGRSGSLTLRLFSDATNAVFEAGAESDNNRSVAITVAPSAAPNLVVTNVTGPTQARPGDKVMVSYHVENQGAAVARPDWTDRIYLVPVASGDTMVGAKELKSIVRNQDVAATTGFYDVTQQVTMPDVVDGPYRIVVVVDTGDNVWEGPADTGNKLASADFSLTHPDLRPEAVIVVGGGEAQSGSTIEVHWTVRNQGKAAASPWTDTLWLRSLSNPSAPEVQLGTFRHSALAGESSDETAVVLAQLPIGASGDYALRVVSDSGNEVRELEAGELDNVATGALKVDLAPFADLEVTDVDAVSELVGDPASTTVTWTVHNKGRADATGTWIDRVIVSANAILGDADDVVMASVARTGLASLDTYQGTATITFDPKTSKRYHLFVRADAVGPTSAGQVFENGADENAKELETTLDVTPIAPADLEMRAITVEGEAKSGGQISVTWTVANIGDGMTDRDRWADEIFLKRADGTGPEILLKRFNHLGFVVAETGSYTHTTLVDLPEGTSGEYRIYVRAAVNNAVYEFLNTTNNAGASEPITITLSDSPDLVFVGELQAISTAPEGSTIDLTWEVRNDGLVRAEGTWIDRVFMRKEGDTGPGTEVGSYTYQGPLESGVSYRRREEIRLPTHTSDAYEIYVVTDQTKAIYEANESNNRSSLHAITVQVKPRPDLTVSSIVATTAIKAGERMAVRYTVLNQGALPTAGSWTDEVWLSIDDKITADDILISRQVNQAALEAANDPLGRDRYSVDSPSFVLPQRFSGENIHILVRADSGNAIDEWPNDTAESNIGKKPFTVDEITFPDLVVSNPVAPAQVFEGSEFTVTWTVTNRGLAPTQLANWSEQIWLSTHAGRPHPSKGDILLTTVPYADGVLVKDQGKDRTATVKIPDRLPSGNYFITAWSDPYGTMLEEPSTEYPNDDSLEFNDNNFKARPIIVVGTPVPNGGTTSVGVSGVAAQVDTTTRTLTANWTVTAAGDRQAGTWIDRVYLTNAPTLDASTQRWELGAFGNLKSLAPGGSYTAKHTFDLGPATQGTYIIVRSDYLGDAQPIDNEDSDPAVVTAAPADMRVMWVESPAAVESGEQTSVTYRVENKGAPIWSGTQYWTDTIYVSKDAEFRGDRATKVATSIRQAGDGQDYTNTVAFNVPPGSDGQWYVHVFTNTDGGFDTAGVNEGSIKRFTRSIFETPNTNNHGAAAFPVTYKEADLRIEEFDLPDSIQAGSTFLVRFLVKNHGERATREESWIDRVYLSIDGALDTSDWQMETVQGGKVVRAESIHRGVLGKGESYWAEAWVTLPFELKGALNVIAGADAGMVGTWLYESSLSPRLQGLTGNATGVVREFRDEGNNDSVEAIQVVESAVPNLQVRNVVVDAQITRGQPFTVTYEVWNDGGATPPEQGAWDELIYISRDPVLDLTTDRFLASYTHSGGLGASSGYPQARTVTLPADLAQSAYYVFVVVDPTRTTATGKVYETNERDNDSASNQFIARQADPVNLVVDPESIIIPQTSGSALKSGDNLNISWKVKNDSNRTLQGSWRDAVYLSVDGTWDVDDVYLGFANYSGTLLAGQSYDVAASLPTTLPSVLPGNYRIIIRSDILNQVWEDTGEADNAAASKTSFTTAVDTMTVGIPLETTLAPGQERLYRIEVQGDKTLRLRLDAEDPKSASDIFLRHDAKPSAATYDEGSLTLANGDRVAIVPDTKPGVYYVLVRGASGPAAGSKVTLLADYLPLVVTDIATDRGGDGKFVTTTITGAQFHEDAIVKLKRPQIAEYEPISWEVIDGTKIVAKFDLTGAPHGLYDLEVTNPDGSQATLPYRFLVERQIEADVSIGVGGPRVILAGDTGIYSVGLTNQSNVDAPYTLFQIGVPQLGINPYVYGIPYLDAFTNVRGTPDGAAAGTVNANVPWNSLDPFINALTGRQRGQLLTTGFVYDQHADGHDGFTFNVTTYPGLKELAEKAFDSFRTQMAAAYPEFAHMLEKGPAGLDAWWSAVKEDARATDPAYGAALDELDLPGLLQGTASLPSADDKVFIPYRFHLAAAATSMTRAEFVAYQTALAIDLRQAVLTSTTAPASLVALAADEEGWVGLYLAALESSGALRPEGTVPPIREGAKIVSLMSTLASGILFGPAGNAIRSDGDLPKFFEQVRKLYGADGTGMAEIEYWDKRKTDKREGSIPVPLTPTAGTFDLGLSHPTHFQVFRVYVPWLDFAQRGLGLPDELAQLDLAGAEGGNLADLDFGKLLGAGTQGTRLSSLNGPSTVDTGGWLPTGLDLPYSVKFQNPAGTSGYVNEISIVTQLDGDLDARTFQFGDIQVGDISIDVPDGRRAFQADYDFVATRGFVLRVSAVLDQYQQPAVARWLIQAIDPQTGEVLQDRTRGRAGLCRLDGEAEGGPRQRHRDRRPGDGRAVGARARDHRCDSAESGQPRADQHHHRHPDRHDAGLRGQVGRE